MTYDLRYALRSLVRAPRFAFAVMFAIALGIGGCTAVFSVVDRILFRSLPYPAADQLISFGMVAPIAPQEFMLGYDYLDWRSARGPIEAFGSFSGVDDCDFDDRNPVRLRCGRVESALLPALGVQPVAGRNFTREEDRPGGPRAALISSAIWRSRFAGDPGAIGRSVLLDGQPSTIVGVLPGDFELPASGPVDILIPQALDEAEQQTRRTATMLSAVARLKPGTTIEQASAALDPLFRKSLEGVPPQFRKDVKLRLRWLRDRQVQDARQASWILLGAVLAVLLIACANAANLLLARMAAREREFAVRAALGAGRLRLIRQNLVESVVLAAGGGIAGCALAFLLVRAFVAIAPDGITGLHRASLDWRVLAFTTATAFASGILCGFAPAVRSARAAAPAGSRAVGSRSHLLRESLVALQIGASLVLLTGAGLLLRSLWNLQNQPLGLKSEGVLTASVRLGRHSYSDPGRRLAYLEELERRMAAIPGVTEAAISDSLPPSGGATGPMIYGAIDVEGRPQHRDGTGGSVVWRAITPRYFQALGIPMIRGRAFTEADRDPSRNVVILSESLARRLFPGEEPLGRNIKPGRIGPWLSVIGVARDVKNSGLAESGAPEFYQIRKHAPQNTSRTAIVILRSAADASGLATWVRREFAALDRAIPVTIESIDQRIGKLAQRPRFNALLLALFASLGVLLAAVGLYGVMSFIMAQRVPEIGVRMALGAQPFNIIRQMLGYAARPAIAGAAAGTLASIFAVRWLESMLFQVTAKDPWMLPVSVFILFAVALLAAWMPAHRASRLNPVEALRQD